MKRRTFINSLLITAATMGIIQGVEILKEQPKTLQDKSLSFEKFFLMVNMFHMNEFQKRYYSYYSNSNGKETGFITGSRQQGMSTLMYSIALYEHKILRKSVAIIPMNMNSRLRLEQKLNAMTNNLYISGHRWAAPERSISIITKNEYRVKTDLLFVECYPFVDSNYYHPSQKALSDKTFFFGATETEYIS